MHVANNYAVNCGTPSTGDNVIVDGLTPTRVAQGTNVTFRCQSGQSFSLIGPTRATCSEDGSWKPSTNDVECVSKFASCVIAITLGHAVAS